MLKIHKRISAWITNPAIKEADKKIKAAAVAEAAAAAKTNNFVL
jgi:hypothetical protein